MAKNNANCISQMTQDFFRIKPYDQKINEMNKMDDVSNVA